MESRASWAVLSIGIALAFAAVTGRSLRKGQEGESPKAPLPSAGPGIPGGRDVTSLQSDLARQRLTNAELKQKVDRLEVDLSVLREVILSQPDQTTAVKAKLRMLKRSLSDPAVLASLDRK